MILTWVSYRALALGPRRSRPACCRFPAVRAEPDGSSVLWGSRGGCRSLVLRDLRVGATAGRMRVSAQGRAHLGVRFLGFCFARLAWSGRVESLARPEMGDDWRLRLRDLD